MNLPLNKDVIERIIHGDTKELIDTAKRVGEDLKRDGLTTSQIRNIFASVKKMEMKGFNEKELLFLKPQLAYAAARSGAKEGTKKLKDILTSAIDAVGNDEKRFENFCKFFEAILAYYQAAGWK